MEKKRILVILSGCGVKDGSEIQESVLTLLALDRAGAETLCAAPNIMSTLCVDHFRGTKTNETRNVLTESARIARGHIIPLSQVELDQIDGIILPGGLGAACNLSDFAYTQDQITIEPELQKLLLAAHQKGKPLGFICIAPVIAATLFGSEGIRYTLGNDQELAARFAKNGAEHINCPPSEAVTDEKLKIVTTPAFMLAESLAEAEPGITQLVNEVLKLA